LFDGSEFGDIFDVEHFKTSLKDDVRIVSALPSRLLMYRPTDEKNIPLNASPRWLRAHYAKKVSTIFSSPPPLFSSDSSSDSPPSPSSSASSSSLFLLFLPLLLLLLLLLLSWDGVVLHSALIFGHFFSN
jgi:hypothetical protein